VSVGLVFLGIAFAAAVPAQHSRIYATTADHARNNVTNYSYYSVHDVNNHNITTNHNNHNHTNLEHLPMSLVKKEHLAMTIVKREHPAPVPVKVEHSALVPVKVEHSALLRSVSAKLEHPAMVVVGHPNNITNNIQRKELSNNIQIKPHLTIEFPAENTDSKNNHAEHRSPESTLQPCWYLLTISPSHTPFNKYPTTIIHDNLPYHFVGFYVLLSNSRIRSVMRFSSSVHTHDDEETDAANKKHAVLFEATFDPVDSSSKHAAALQRMMPNTRFSPQTHSTR